MSIHINKFIDLIKAQESRGGRDVSMPLRDAKDLHADITKLLLAIETLRSNKPTTPTNNDVITVEMTGGSFK